MPYAPTTGDRLLAAWLSLTSTLWNKRLVSTLTYNEAHVLGILLRAEDTAVPVPQRRSSLKRACSKAR